MRTPALIATALLAASLTACGSATSEEGTAQDGASGTQPSGTPPTPDTVPGTPSELPKPSSSPTVPPPVDADPPPGLRERPAVERAVADAAKRSNVAEPRVVVAAFTPVTWNDGSLGCPQPDESYTAMQVEGELLLLSVDDELLSYHAGDDGSFTYCAEPTDGYTVRPG